ncbi:HNH endonuclease [Pseudomonas siliginis]|uniref:HNH endonuclease n=1 Tax=Pseudomonas siliginis TaxID=2842346 RepID=UPI0020939A25|nr:HNH endonuclease [Pseudomonas siliginis]UST77155.1 HNH endonuclease [Pseudomonas siliginis]
MSDHSEHDPADVDPEKVVPKEGLGTGLEQTALPALFFSTKSKIWGDKSGNELEPVGRDYKSSGLKNKVMLKDGFRCMFCGFHSSHNQIHSLSDNHRDIREQNLRVADHLCHGWQHLGELGDGNAVVAFLPGLAAQDVNHLQRSIMIALQADDPSVRADAKKILNWLGSHRRYVQDAWGTFAPAVFAQAMVRQDDGDKGVRELVFEDLAIVFNPGPYSQVAALWASESRSSYPVAKWSEVYFSVMNPPA